MGKWTALKAAKVVTASSYWLIKEPNGYIYEAEFYQQIRNQLVLMDAGRVELKLPDTVTSDRTLSAPLRLTWMWDD